MTASRPIAPSDIRALLDACARDARLSTGGECPDCGGTDIEDNGGTEYRCVTCDHRWGYDHGERYGF